MAKTSKVTIAVVAVVLLVLVYSVSFKLLEMSVRGETENFNLPPGSQAKVDGAKAQINRALANNPDAKKKLAAAGVTL